MSYRNGCAEASTLAMISILTCTTTINTRVVAREVENRHDPDGGCVDLHITAHYSAQPIFAMPVQTQNDTAGVHLACIGVCLLQ